MNDYTASIKELDKAEKYIPNGCQTFSKSQYSFPKGGAPLFLEKGQGAYVWDVDGNKYIDLVSGLLSLSLGYNIPKINRAITEQLNKGINFSLSTTLECELAELLIDLIPCAEKVRFGKNGSDVTSAAIRLSRAYTGRNSIAVCGYHGWHDWYIGSTSRNLGVPKVVSELTHSFKYNDLDSIKEIFVNHGDDLAAVILEPMNTEYPKKGFLEGVRELCDQYKTVLIFDEMITGFRFNLGGAQKLFTVTPDLATFGKGIGNGMPISVITGKNSIMKLMDEIFFSGTFGGECLSLAASISVINFMSENDVPNVIHDRGLMLTEKIESLSRLHNSDEWFSLVGHPSWKIWKIKPGFEENKQALIELLADSGVLTSGSHNLSYSHDIDEINFIANAYDTAFKKIECSENVCELIRGERLKPVFSIR